jgi:hypothetical protein
MNTSRVDEKNSTATDTFKVEKDDVKKSVIYIPGLKHGGFLEMQVDVLIALCHDSGMHFDFSLKNGTLFPRLDRPLTMMTVANDMESCIEKLLWDLMVLNQRVKEKIACTSNFQEIAAALAEELQLQRSRPIARRDPKDRMAPCWDKIKYAEMPVATESHLIRHGRRPIHAKPRPTRNSLFEGSSVPSMINKPSKGDFDEEDEEFMEEYVIETDSDDSQNELNDLREEMETPEERNELDNYLETYTNIPNYTELRMNWTLLNEKIDSERVLSQLKTAKLVSF